MSRAGVFVQRERNSSEGQSTERFKRSMGGGGAEKGSYRLGNMRYFLFPSKMRLYLFDDFSVHFDPSIEDALEKKRLLSVHHRRRSRK